MDLQITFPKDADSDFVVILPLGVSSSSSPVMLVSDNIRAVVDVCFFYFRDKAMVVGCLWFFLLNVRFWFSFIIMNEACS